MLTEYLNVRSLSSWYVVKKESIWPSALYDTDMHGWLTLWLSCT